MNKKMIFLAAGFAAVMMTACGGEKTEEKKEEKKEISEASLTLLEELKNNWMTIDNDLIGLSNDAIAFSGLSFSSNLDSLKLVIEKSPKAIKEAAMPLLDSIKNDQVMADGFKIKLESERNDWDLAKGKFLELQTSIEKNEIGEEEAVERLNSSKALFDSFLESINQMKAEVEQMKINDEAFKSALIKK